MIKKGTESTTGQLQYLYCYVYMHVVVYGTDAGCVSDWPV